MSSYASDAVLLSSKKKSKKIALKVDDTITPIKTVDAVPLPVEVDAITFAQLSNKKNIKNTNTSTHDNKEQKKKNYTTGAIDHTKDDAKTARAVAKDAKAIAKALAKDAKEQKKKALTLTNNVDANIDLPELPLTVTNNVDANNVLQELHLTDKKEEAEPAVIVTDKVLTAKALAKIQSKEDAKKAKAHAKEEDTNEEKQ